MLNRIQPGVSTDELQREIINAMEEAKRYKKVGWCAGHIHGIGLGMHELPFAGGVERITQPIPFFRHYRLEPGMVFTVECAAKARDLGGHCNTESMVLVTEKGFELLDTVGIGLHVV